MFNKLRNTLKKLAKGLADAITTRTLSEDEIEALMEDYIIELVESDVSYEAAQYIVSKLKERLIGHKIPRFRNVNDIVRQELSNLILEILKKVETEFNIVNEVEKVKDPPYRMVFFGVNGVGKTTTIAKIAYMLKRNNITPVIVAADTYRAGAQEQLKIHANRLGVPFIGGKYGADPASIAYDAIQYARSRGYRAVLIDTAGRMHTDVDLMNELRKIVKVVKPHAKVLILDSLVGNDALEQARFFENAVGIDYIILTKLDADVKGGTALSVAYSVSKPIIYVGIGQKYQDLAPYKADEIARKILEEES